MGVVLGDADIVVCSDNNSIVIESSGMHAHEDDHISEEVVHILRTAHNMSLSKRNMLKLERQCTRKEIMERRSKRFPHFATALEVSFGVVLRRLAAVCPLVEVVQNQLTLSTTCGTFIVTRQNRLLIIMCADVTPLWQTSTTKCDVHMTIWSKGVAVAGNARRWATWWALDGPDDTHILRAIDTKGDLNQHVLDVQSTVDVSCLRNHIPSVCVCVDK